MRTLLRALCACAAVVLGAEAARGDPETDAVEALKKVGAQILRDDDDPAKPVVNVIFKTGKEPVADALPHLAALPKLRAVSFPYVIKLDDEGAKHLAKLDGLRQLTLVGTSLTDKGMEHLSKLKNLERLELASTPVGDAGFKHLAGLTKLRHLGLNATKVTGEGFKELHELKALEHVTLFNTPATDAGLKQLAGLKGLKRVDLKSTKVTDAGKKELQQALPDLKID